MARDLTRKKEANKIAHMIHCYIVLKLYNLIRLHCPFTDLGPLHVCERRRHTARQA